MMEQDSLEKAQRRRITFLEDENSKLQKENDILRASLTHQTIESENSFRDNIDKFDIIARQIWAVVADLNKTWQRPATYDEIVKAYQRQYPNVACGETICRRVRKMVEDGWMDTPIRGSFIVVAKPNP
jgi:regulator of replication initiation timing